VALLRAIVLTIRFACELAMLAALAAAGHSLARGAAAWALALAPPALAGITWGLFVAPKAKRPVPIPARIAIELVLFALATAGLMHIGHPTFAAVFAGAAVVTSLVNAGTAPRVSAARAGSPPYRPGSST
jgi:hypothetical protein